MKPVPEYVTLRLAEWEPVGTSQMIVRTTEETREDIEKAARHLGMTLSHFTRMILGQAARKVLAEGSQHEVG